MSMRIAVVQDRYDFDMLGGRISKGENLFNALDDVDAQNGRECGDKIDDESGWKSVGRAWNELRPGIMSDRDYEIILGKLFDAISKSGCSELKGGATCLLTRVKAPSSLRKFAGNEFTLGKAIYYGDGKCMYKILDNQHFRNILHLIGVNSDSRIKFIDRAKKVTPAKLPASARVQEAVCSLLEGICEVADSNDVDFSPVLEIKRKKDFEVLLPNKKIKFVKISEGASSIPAGAFRGCTSLEGVIIPKSVKSICKHAFLECGHLKSLDIPEGSVETIGYGAFKDCIGLKEIKFPSSVKLLSSDGQIFQGCTSLEKVVINGEVKSISQETFSGCTGLKEIKLSNSVERICEKAFERCTNLKEIVFSGSVRCIGAWAFSQCTNLKEIVLPDGVENIGAGAFARCSELEKIVIPGSVKTICGHTFLKCEKLKEIVISDGVESIGIEAFSGCSELEKIVIPGSVKTIRGSAFSRCENLKEIVISDGVESIGIEAFSRCKNLEKVTIPSSVSNIDAGAFSKCSNLNTIWGNPQEKVKKQIEKQLGKVSLRVVQ